MRKLPPLNAVKSFEAAARHGSFTRAAEELLVTHGAVSRQVALLEDWFGIKLFRRTPSHVSLTDAGRTYYLEVTALLDRLALASMDMKQAAAPTMLRINAPPTFTMRWLMRRISAFQRQRADVELRLTTALGPIAPNDGGFDVAIRGDQGELAGWRSSHFMTELIAPVCHVDLLARNSLTRPRDLRRHRLVTYLTEPYAWDQWLAQAGGEMAPEQETQRFEQMYFALQAVQDQLGIGLFPLFLVIDELMAGRLCVPFGPLGLRRRDYRCFYKTEGKVSSVVRDFEAWLGREGEATERETLAWASSMGWKF